MSQAWVAKRALPLRSLLTAGVRSYLGPQCPAERRAVGHLRSFASEVASTFAMISPFAETLIRSFGPIASDVIGWQSVLPHDPEITVACTRLAPAGREGK